MDRQPPGSGTIDQNEVERFSRIAGQWWDPRGPMAALHKFNPVRLAFIRDRSAAHFGCYPWLSRQSRRPADSGYRLRRRRAVSSRWRGSARRWLAPTPSEKQHRGGATACRAFRAFDRLPRHQRRSARRCRRNFRHRSRDGGDRRHATDASMFVELAAAMVKTRRAAVRRHAEHPHRKSFALAIVGAEYILRWLPRGTHQWESSSRPANSRPRSRCTGLRGVSA